MEVKVLLSADENLLNAINNLSEAVAKSKLMSKIDPEEISDADMAKDDTDNEKYTMFNDMAAAAQKLKEADLKTYKKVLHKYVDEGKKYSAVLPKDWSKAMTDFKKALKDLSKAKAQEEDEDVENEEANIAKETMYYMDVLDDTIGIVKKGEAIPDNEDLEFITKALYLKKKKAIEAAKEEESEEIDDEGDCEDDDTPRLTINELRALASQASNAGVKVGAILNKIGGTKKVSALSPSVYDAVEDELRKQIAELED